MAAQGRYAVRSTIASLALAVFALCGVSPVATLAARQAPVAAAPALQPSQALTLEAKEAFLKKAKIVRTKGAGKGVTGTLRATLTDGVLTHDASIQTVDQAMSIFSSNRGTELNFRDSWRYNVAAYRLDQLLQVGMIPPSVERSYDNKSGAYTWWVDDVIMDEGGRLKDKLSAPDSDKWNRQMWHVRLFDQLIYNVDRNLGNLVIDKDWTVWMIDHTRAFRLHEKVKTPGNLSKCDRQVLDRLKALDMPAVKAAVGNYLTASEIKAMLARRTEIVALIEKGGPGALYDLARP
jgi:hypothetical protein